jgi:aromatic-L-amino-acid decarboxylase
MSFHMTPDEFRKQGHAAIEWVARYMEEVEKYPVLSQVKPGDIRAQLPVSPPEHGESLDDLLRDMDQIVMPGITHWQSPDFFAYFPANTSGPSIIGDLLSAGLNVQGMMWINSPALTENEAHMRTGW